MGFYETTDTSSRNVAGFLQQRENEK